MNFIFCSIIILFFTYVLLRFVNNPDWKVQSARTFLLIIIVLLVFSIYYQTTETTKEVSEKLQQQYNTAGTDDVIVNDANEYNKKLYGNLTQKPDPSTSVNSNPVLALG